MALFVNFPSVAILHMGFHNKERHPKLQNNFLCRVNAGA